MTTYMAVVQFELGHLPPAILCLALALTLLFLLAMQILVLRHNRRFRLGLCTRCGYDLRASLCPECGQRAGNEPPPKV